MPQVSVGGNGLGLGSQVWAVAHERCLSLGKRRRSLTSQKQNGMATFLLKRVREVGEMVIEEMLSSCRCTAVRVSNFCLPLPIRPSRLRERGDS